MSKWDRDEQQSVRELAYFLWESDGKPEGLEFDYWKRAVEMRSNLAQNPEDVFEQDEEAVLDGDPHADLPALLTKDVPGG